MGGQGGEGAREGWWPEDPDDTDLGPDDDSPPSWFPGQHLPEHARRSGLTHHTQEGALLDFAGALDSAKPLHRLTAWVLLAIFGLPVLIQMWRLLAHLSG